MIDANRNQMMHIRSFLFMLIVLGDCCWSSTLSAQIELIDHYVQLEMKKRRIPGVAVVVIREREITKMEGYGFANLEHDVRVSPDTVFELASLTKQFTAAAIMVLLEQNKLSLADSIMGYLPNSPEQWRAITIRHLLTHTGGFPDPANGFQSLREGGERTDYTTAQLFDAAKKDNLNFVPGKRWQYSDVGYFLLGMIIERASGQSYRGFLTRHFFAPLDMPSTSVLNQWAVLKNRAAGYSLRNGQIVNIRRVAQVELPSHFGIFSSVRDLAKWDNALRSGKVVKTLSLDQMWMPVKLNSGASYPYGFGWAMDGKGEHPIITHDGITGTEYSRFPNDNLTVIVLTNLGRRHRGDTEVNSWGLTKEIAARLIPNFPKTGMK